MKFAQGTNLWLPDGTGSFFRNRFFLSQQVLSFAVGPRDGETGRKMWEDIPVEYRKKQFYTDDLNIYHPLIPWS
jgi:hypothetical protein